MKNSSRPGSVVMTDWAASPDYLRVDRADFINEILILSLLYDEVLLQDELLVLSDTLATWFSSKEGYDLWRELMDVGSIVILRHPDRAYPTDELKNLSQRHPIEARTKYIEKYGSKEDLPFKASETHQKFNANIESSLTLESGRIREVGARREMEIMPEFVQTLKRVLTDPHYSQWLKVCFPQLSATDITRFHEFACNPKKLVSELNKAKMKRNVLNEGHSVVFNRSLAYQATNLFKKKKQDQLKQLIQSAFAVPFCLREDAIGRYGGFLKSIPTLLVDQLDGALTLNPLVEVHAHITIPLNMPIPERGFASIIANVRNTDAGKNLRKSVATLGPSLSFEYQKECWGAVANKLAEQVVKPRKLNVSIYELGAKIIHDVKVGVFAHAVEIAFRGHGDVSHFFLETLLASANHGTMNFLIDNLQGIWGLSKDEEKKQELYLKLQNAVDFQCIWHPESNLSNAQGIAKL